MKIHLLRHAKTAIDSETGKDFDRALLPKGIIQANVDGYFLLHAGTEIFETWCSDSVRTQQTYQVLSKFIDCGKVNFINELYLADRETLLAKIWKTKHNKEILLIGHNDGISSLASYLTDKNVHLKTGGYVCISFEADSWREVSCGTGTIVNEFRPQVYFPD